MNTTPLDNYQSFIHLSRYARWLPEEGRRETWDETVDRYIAFFESKFGDVLNPELWEDLRDAIYHLEVMPSMRALMTAGPALERDNVAGYNCSYLSMSDPHVFGEIMYILMCGTGVGFSVEKEYVSKLPEVPNNFTEHSPDAEIIVEDSKYGWAEGFHKLIGHLYDGVDPKVDYSKIRPAGARLKIFGGRASGPQPLRKLFEFTKKTFMNAKGRQLTPLEVHDIVCKIADVVVCGGVRRSALISLSDLDDTEMALAKSGEWWKDNSQRALANNSAVYYTGMSKDEFEKEWAALVASGSGERGIFSRTAALIPDRRELRDFGTNPCSEIVLRDKQFCNLSEVVVRPEDDAITLINKVGLATILGTLQSTLDDFPFLSSEWEKNTKEERLLGVSLTGICDSPILSDPNDAMLPSLLDTLKDIAIATNKHYAKELNIEPSKAITCVKPSGTVSQLTNAASGIHPRYAPYYIRRVRMDSKDSLALWMKDKGVPCEKDFYGEGNLVFSFPVKAPQAVYRNDRTAIEQLELWAIYQSYWCEHKPSVTIYVGEEEWETTGEWVWKNLDRISGVSFLPREDGSHTYVQAPYEEIDRESYEQLVSEMPDVDFSEYLESDDNTTASQELACKGGACEIV